MPLKSLPFSSQSALDKTFVKTVGQALVPIITVNVTYKYWRRQILNMKKIKMENYSILRQWMPINGLLDFEIVFKLIYVYQQKYR